VANNFWEAFLVLNVISFIFSLPITLYLYVFNSYNSISIHSRFIANGVDSLLIFAVLPFIYIVQVISYSKLSNK